MDIIRDWALAVCAAAVLGAAMKILAPAGKYEKLMRLSVSALTVLVLVSPLARLDELRIELDTSAAGYNDTGEQLADKVEKQTAALMESAARSLIEAELAGIGADGCAVEILMDISEAGGISIGRVTVRMSDSCGATAAQIETRLRDALGIEAEAVRE